jgi:hypothetical protein
MLRIKSRAFSICWTRPRKPSRRDVVPLIVDSMSHVWAELMESFCRKPKISSIQFEHWRELKQTWRDWSDLMLNSRVHMLVCGREGKEYEYQENEETGKKELISLGAKFRARRGAKRGSHLVHKGDFGSAPACTNQVACEVLRHRHVTCQFAGCRLNVPFEDADRASAFRLVRPGIPGRPVRPT